MIRFRVLLVAVSLTALLSGCMPGTNQPLVATSVVTEAHDGETNAVSMANVPSFGVNRSLMAATEEWTAVASQQASARDSVWAWGQPGPLEPIRGRATRSLPEQMRGLDQVRAIEAGLKHTVVLFADGAVWTRGEPLPDEEPCSLGVCPAVLRPVYGLEDATAISAGDYHSLALQADGTVWAWGDNLSGELGDGTHQSRSLPRAVPGLTQVTAIAAGGSHSLALLQDGTVRAWGHGSHGRLGNGTRDNQTVPGAVQGLTDVVAVAAGGAYSLAVRQDGTVWAWGYRLQHQPNDWSVDRLVPIQVGGLQDVVAVATGKLHGLALTRDGQVWTWGFNEYGELGRGHRRAGCARGMESLVRVCLDELDDWSHPRDTPEAEGLSEPAPVPGLEDVVAIAAGEHHSLALTAGGSVWAWGSNVHGELGAGRTRNPVFNPDPVQVATLSGVQAIAARGTLSLAIQGMVTRRLPPPRFR